MRILFDHGTPAPLRHALLDHEISTAYEMGWAELNRKIYVLGGYPATRITVNTVQIYDSPANTWQLTAPR